MELNKCPSTQQFSNLDFKSLSSNYKETGIKRIKTSMNLPIPPNQLNAPLPYKAVLDKMLQKYHTELAGFLLGYSDSTKPVQNSGTICDEHSTIWTHVRGRFYVFRPEVGQCLEGVVVEKTRDHIGLLLHAIFNISVPIKPNLDTSCLDTGVKVKFKVKRCNLNFSIPYILGELVEPVLGIFKNSVTQNLTQQEVKGKEHMKSKKHLAATSSEGEGGSEVSNVAANHLVNGSKEDLAPSATEKKSKNKRGHSERDHESSKSSEILEVVSTEEASSESKHQKKHKKKKKLAEGL